ncbi:MAG: SoxR reducing system RseC family protein [Bacteroidales bacterium]|nr:SoxR reducing system RseC family protein [Bacteroidales bacterium]
MEKFETIEHDAFVKEIRDDTIIVDVISKSACMSCQVKGVCSVSDIAEKQVEVIRENNDVQIGDKVIVFLAQTLGFKAVFLGYIAPFFIVIFILILMLQLTNNELIAGILSIGILLPYYLILFLMKDKISKKYLFRLK